MAWHGFDLTAVQIQVQTASTLPPFTPRATGPHAARARVICTRSACLRVFCKGRGAARHGAYSFPWIGPSNLSTTCTSLVMRVDDAGCLAGRPSTSFLSSIVHLPPSQCPSSHTRHIFISRLFPITTDQKILPQFCHIDLPDELHLPVIKPL